MLGTIDETKRKVLRGVLCRLIEAGKLETVKLFGNQFFRENDKQFKRFSMQLASVHGHSNIVYFLFDQFNYFTDPNILDECLGDAITQGHSEVVFALRQYMTFMLIKTCESGNIKSVGQLLSMKNLDINNLYQKMFTFSQKYYNFPI